MQIGDFLNAVLDEKSISKKELSTLTGLTPSYISQICLNKKVPTLETVQKICDVLSISLRDFFSFSQPDDDTILLTPNERAYIRTIRSLPKNERAAVWAMVSALSGITPLVSATHKALAFPQRSVDGYAAAGSPLFDDTNRDDTVQVPEKYLDRNRYFIVQARGNSMVPRINDGDYVVVEKEAEPAPGETALVRIDGIASDEYTIKRFYVRGDQIELRSFNPDFSPMCYPLEELKLSLIHI